MKDKMYISIIIILVLIIGILVGLNIGNKNNVKVIEKVKERTIEQNNNIVEGNSNNRPKDEIVEENNNNITKDEIVIKTLENTLIDVENNDTSKSFKESAKSTFINIVDFIFYDGTIKGVTFKELSDEGKEKVLNLANRIDTTIESKIPNYKESITSTANKAYSKASELIKKGSSNLNAFLSEKLSEEDYNSIINAKEEIVDYTKRASSFVKESSSKIFNQSKEKLNNWYQNYKNN